MDGTFELDPRRTKKGPKGQYRVMYRPVDCDDSSPWTVVDRKGEDPDEYFETEEDARAYLAERLAELDEERRAARVEALREQVADCLDATDDEVVLKAVLALLKRK